MNGSPGFFRLWMGRVFWGLVVTIPLAGLVLVLLMIVAELRGLDRARTGLSAADSLLNSAMNAGKPESLPMAIRRLGAATGTTLVLFREDGTPAFSNTRTLDRLKAFTAISEDWIKAPHTPDQFLWPPSSLPIPLSHEVDRIFQRRAAHIVTDREGRASPLAIGGGYAVWTRAIPNRTSCARCHGFDQEVLGHWVAVARVAPIATRRDTTFWGFWPLPGINQRILFGGTAGLVLFSLFLVSLLETWTLHRGLRPKKGSGKKGPVKKKPQVEATRKAVASEEDGSSEMAVSHEEWEALHERLQTLDQSILALSEGIPRSGVTPKKPNEDEIAIDTTLADALAEWSDRFELDLQEIAENPTFKSAPLILRFLEKAQGLRSQAVSLADMVASDREEKTFGVLKAPFFAALSEDQKDWTDRLRAVLGLMHTEVQSIEGIIKNGLARTEGPLEEPEDEGHESPGETPSAR